MLVRWLVMPEITKNWNANQLRFIEWLALPKSERKPKTQGAFAKELGVHETTLSDWKKLPGFMGEVTTLARGQLQNALTDIYAALVKAASSGDVQAIKLALEVSGEYTPKQKVDLDVDVTKLSDDELDALIGT